MTLWHPASLSCPSGGWVQWEHYGCPKVSQTAQASINISAAKSYLCLSSLQRCMAHCVVFSFRLCWLPLLHLFWLKWDCCAPAWHWTIGILSIPWLIIDNTSWSAGCLLWNRADTIKPCLLHLQTVLDTELWHCWWSWCDLDVLLVTTAYLVPARLSLCLDVILRHTHSGLKHIYWSP